MSDPPRSSNGHPGRRAGVDPGWESDADAAFDLPLVHRVRFTDGAFDPANTVLRSVIADANEGTGRAIAFVDAGVASAWPDLPRSIADYATAHPDALALADPVIVVPGGEQAKNDWSVFETVAAAINDSGICRHSYVLVIGGGAVLDAVGFAAATAHRGVRLIRFPTTTLAQDDAGLGVKNGINAFGKKNFLGSFGVPWAVINDERFLSTLSLRDWRAGLSEAVKVALLKDAAFFDEIVLAAPRLAARDVDAARPIVRRSAWLHLDHIVNGGDPYELRNARPLDFGHWSAHKLEQISDFQVRHGEAVAMGLALDVIYSAVSGRLDPAAADRVLDCLTRIGFCLYDDRLADHAAVLDGLEEFREHLGGRMTITLLEAIGRPVDVHEIDRDRMIEAIQRLAEYSIGRGATDRGAGEPAAASRPERA